MILVVRRSLRSYNPSLHARKRALRVLGAKTDDPRCATLGFFSKKKFLWEIFFSKKIHDLLLKPNYIF